MIIMGIDSSTTSTGWAVIDTKHGGALRLIDHGTISPPKKYDTIERIIYISDKFKELLRIMKPELVVIEQMNVTTNMNTVRVLAGLLTEIEVTLKRQQYLYTLLTPSQWRKAVGIKGKKREEFKLASQAFVLNNFYEKVNEDEADAVCIAEAGSKLEVENE